jgi:phage tail-like protein
MSIPLMSMAGLGLSPGLPSYGMAMRFTVQVDGLNLGHWSGCKGLKMDFKVTRLRQGGNYGYDLIIPDQVVGSAVTLERAMEKTDSAAVQTWLASVAQKWTSYSGTGDPYRGTTATITLFDVTGVATASWTLYGVFPSSWSGPGLSATDNKVAIETLVLEYQAITPGSTPATPSVATASLSQGTSPTVTFPFSPEKISLSHSAKLEEITTDKSATATELTYEDALKGIGPTTIGLSGLTFDGEKVKTGCEQLLKWTNAVTPQGSKVPELPLLTFKWGSIVWDVKLTSADITYTRFSANGVPTRAQANLKCVSRTNPPTGTNPTSGGLPGRRSHVVIAGESLQHIAMASYGRPGAWRAVAAANGIEDPLRVRPGAVVYLPGPDELATGSPA